jgi:hypothetical protein
MKKKKRINRTDLTLRNLGALKRQFRQVTQWLATQLELQEAWFEAKHDIVNERLSKLEQPKPKARK